MNRRKYGNSTKKKTFQKKLVTKEKLNEME